MPSKTQVDKAGAALREWWYSPRRMDDDLRKAVGVVWEYRDGFQYPTTKVSANLRHYVKRAGVEVVIAQRLKRLPRIIEKLAKQPRMRMSQMQDVGGCRAVLPDDVAVGTVLAGLRRNWDIITVDDYVGSPKDSGYRAVHVIVRKDSVPVEVQLRTTGQQDWADEIERIDGMAEYGLKDGEGPDEVLRYMFLLAEVIDHVARGESWPNEWDEEMDRLTAYLP